jgi:hypothetical protein
MQILLRVGYIRGFSSSLVAGVTNSETQSYAYLETQANMVGESRSEAMHNANNQHRRGC